MLENGKTVLEVENLTIRFSRYDKGLRKSDLTVINGMGVSVGLSELVAVVGSSGSGKSLLAHTLLGILPSNCGATGKIRFLGETLGPRELAELRGHQIILVPQSVTYLDPLKKVGPQVRNDRKDPESIQAQEKLFDYYGLKRETANLYPFELSGGMARRVLLSAAMMESPRLIIADEPTPGLHLSAAKKAMANFRAFADQGNGVLLITHDLELALEVADKIAVFYAGTTVEVAPVKDFGSAETLRHPYTKALWHALPQNGFRVYPGSQPYAGDDIKGCPFAERCQMAIPACGGDIPTREIRGGLTRCLQAV
ncbi:MAG: ABC transporter ATP-binding protein [Deltaproteobacteria bacterium]|nr:ABC transporter ATP-binding protein [Deltaproteobacteria bacterium]